MAHYVYRLTVSPTPPTGVRLALEGAHGVVIWNTAAPTRELVSQPLYAPRLTHYRWWPQEPVFRCSSKLIGRSRRVSLGSSPAQPSG